MVGQQEESHLSIGQESPGDPVTSPQSVAQGEHTMGLKSFKINYQEPNETYCTD